MSATESDPFVRRNRSKHESERITCELTRAYQSLNFTSNDNEEQRYALYTQTDARELQL